MSLSVALANEMAQTISAALANGTLNFYAGDPATTGVLLATGQLPIAPFTAATGGQISLAGQWFASCMTPGIVTNFLILDSTSTYKLGGTVGLSGSGADMIINNATIALGNVISVTSFSYTVPTT